MHRFFASVHTRWAALVVLALLVPPLWEWPERLWNMLGLYTPAIEVHDGVITTQQVLPGQPLIAKLTIVQRYPCEGVIDRVWFSGDGTTVYKQRAPFAGVAVNGDTPVSRLVKYEQPAGLTPGRYTIRTNATVTCDDHREYRTGPREMSFEVVAPSETSKHAVRDVVEHVAAE
jgi:hypothetical protein